MREGTQRLLEVSHGLAVGRPRHGLLPRLPAIRQGLVPHLAPQGMVGQAVQLLGHPLPGERFKGLDNAGMQRPPPLQQEAAVRDLMGEGVLEGVLVLGEEPCLVEELGALQGGQVMLEHRLRHVGNRVQQRPGHLHANDGRRLQQALLLGWQPVDTRRQHGLHGGGDLDTRQSPPQAIGPALADEHPRLGQGAHALLQEEGIALGARNEQVGERFQTRVVPQQGL
jgi:hypothetical protein